MEVTYVELYELDGKWMEIWLSRMSDDERAVYAREIAMALTGIGLTPLVGTDDDVVAAERLRTDAIIDARVGLTTPVELHPMEGERLREWLRNASAQTAAAWWIELYAKIITPHALMLLGMHDIGSLEVGS
ncbi:MAG: hypothetical protein QM758_13620 [Armatimonas sp.]